LLLVSFPHWYSEELRRRTREEHFVRGETTKEEKRGKQAEPIITKTQDNSRNGPSLWDILGHRWDHKLKDWNYKMEAQLFPSNNNFKYLMMTM
jgi:hypothetical protein